MIATSLTTRKLPTTQLFGCEMCALTPTVVVDYLDYYYCAKGRPTPKRQNTCSKTAKLYIVQVAQTHIVHSTILFSCSGNGKRFSKVHHMPQAMTSQATTQSVQFLFTHISYIHIYIHRSHIFLYI